MRTLSPSSRLVLAVLLVAVIALLIVGATRPFATVPSNTATPSGVAVLPSLTSGSTGSAAGSSNEAGTPSEGASAVVSPPPASAATTLPPGQSAEPTPHPTGCTPTDQDQYIYHPYRLAVQATCVYVTGTIAAVRREADGDLHILLALDATYAYLLTPANQGVELGDLVVEPVCVRPVTQADAIAICASDPDPLPGPFPAVGDTVWMEGRYVFDLGHAGWAELHPLYRFGYR